jgi:nucleotidyltransferase/DNA polymerase involved in DNA repair
MPKDNRQLRDLVSIGPAMLCDFELLGVRSVADLARKNPDRLYEKLCEIAPQHQDICVLDTFRAAVAQARDPRLPAEQREWWWWSKKRKAVESQPLKVETKKRKKP